MHSIYSNIATFMFNLSISLVIAIITGIISGLFVGHYYELQNLKNRILYEIRRIDYWHSSGRVKNPEKECKEIQESLTLLGSELIYVSNKNGNLFSEVKNEIIDFLGVPIAYKDIEKRYSLWQEKVRCLKLNGEDFKKIKQEFFDILIFIKNKAFKSVKNIF